MLAFGLTVLFGGLAVSLAIAIRADAKADDTVRRDPPSGS
jgi:hypothetical protein